MLLEFYDIFITTFIYSVFLPAFYCAGKISIQIFNSTGADRNFTVPPGITTLTIKAWGAGGGSDSSGVGLGGAGGFSVADVTVSPGEILTVRVGQGGAGARFMGYTYIFIILTVITTVWTSSNLTITIENSHNDSLDE
jgi:hypothetical protein